MKKTNLLRLLFLFTTVFVLLVGCGSNDEGSEAANGEGESGSSVDYPNQPIEIVVPWAAGGSSDQTARALSESMSDNIDQNVSVVNREGAGGVTATTEIALEQPDAHTILFNAVGVFSTQPKLNDVEYSMDDFKPITGLTYEPIVLLVNADSPWEDLDDLIEEEGMISFGHSGSGGLPDLAQATFFDQAGVESESVAYEGQNPAITSLLGGNVDTVAAHPGDIMQHLESGDLKALGIFSPERYEDLPDVPTFEEKGFPIDMSVWKYLLVSQETPDEVVEELTSIVEESMEEEEYKEFLETANLTPQQISGEEVEERLEENIEEHGEAIDNMGITNEE